MAIIWKDVEANVNLEAFVGDATNKAFSLRRVSANNFMLESHVTGHPATELITAANDAAAIVAGKALVETLLDQYGVPLEGTQLGYQMN